MSVQLVFPIQRSVIKVSPLRCLNCPTNALFYPPIIATNSKNQLHTDTELYDKRLGIK